MVVVNTEQIPWLMGWNASQLRGSPLAFGDRAILNLTDHAKTKLCLQGFDEQEGADGYAHFRPHESADRCVIGGVLRAHELSWLMATKNFQQTETNLISPSQYPP
eukprot:scaffold15408_cov41-Cyclotella_meneghiniana.AAC.1